MNEFTPEDLSWSPPANLAEANDFAPPTAFVTAFLADRRRIFEYILMLLPNPTDAEDVLQETATLLWQCFAEFQPGTSFLAWARKVAYYKVCEFRRAKSRQVMVLDDEVLQLVAKTASADETPADSRRAALQACLQKLSDRDQSLIQRRYLSRTSGKEVARELGRSADSVYKSLGRIRRTLLECIRRTVQRAEREGTA